MCVLQDFEAITPNLLARTIETVEGGGLVVLLLKTMTSLRQLYAMTMVRPIILYSYLRNSFKLLGCTFPLSDFSARLCRSTLQRAFHPFPWLMCRLPSPG